MSIQWFYSDIYPFSCGHRYICILKLLLLPLTAFESQIKISIKFLLNFRYTSYYVNYYFYYNRNLFSFVIFYKICFSFRFHFFSSEIYLKFFAYIVVIIMTVVINALFSTIKWNLNSINFICEYSSIEYINKFILWLYK